MQRKRYPIPHSWSIATWPEDVWPHRGDKARYVVRANRSDLIAAGVLTRVGRELIVLGDRYARWLEKQAANVPGYEMAMNRARVAGVPPTPSGVA